MKFIVKSCSSKEKINFIYDEEGYAFDVDPLNKIGFTSLMLNDLRLEINDDGTVLYVWGFCPLIRFEEINEVPADCRSGTIVAILKDPPTPGVSIRIDNKKWPLSVNVTKGWVCLGDPKRKGDQTIEFASGCVAVLENQEICAVWLKPVQLPNSVKR